MNNMQYCANWLSELVKRDENVYLLIIDGWENYLFDEGKKSMTEEQKSRIINMGISEQNAVSVASGLALGGKTVYLFMFAAFLTSRAAEQIKLDACYNNANVKFIGIHGGVSGPRIAGYSHWALEDIASLNAYPNIKIAVPSACESEIKYYLEYSLKNQGPMYIRIDNPGMPHLIPDKYCEVGKMSKIIGCRCPEFAILAMGNMVYKAYEASKKLEHLGYNPAVYSCHSIKPFDYEGLKDIINKKIPIIVMEEHSKYGSLTSIVADFIVKNGGNVKFKSFNVEKEEFNKVFVKEQSVNRLLGMEYLEKQIVEFITTKSILPKWLFYIKHSIDKKGRGSLQYRIFGIPFYEKKIENNGRKSFYILGVRSWKSA